MAITNHLSGQEFAAIAAGRHVAQGHLYLSYSTGAAPNHRVALRQILGFGEWEAPEKVLYDNGTGAIVIPEGDYIFHDGTQTESGAFFPSDSAHTGFVMLDMRLPQGFEEADTKKNPPTGARFIGKTQKFPDFDSAGNQIDAGGNIVSTIDEEIDWTKIYYTASPARVLAGRMFKFGKIKRTRVNWEKWAEFRDYHAATEENDYRNLEGLDGFGLSAEYYNDTAFNELAATRIDKSVYFALSNGAPAAGVDPDTFSVRWTGFIKPKFSETYTFTIFHRNGVQLTVNNTLLIDQSSSNGTHTATFQAAANTFYPILIEWVHGSGDAEIILKWSSPSTPIEIIKPENLYPASSDEPRYEIHDFYSAPTELDRMIDAVLLNTNSIKQEVEGRMEFYSVEQLQPVFHFDYTLPETENPFIDGTLELVRSDVSAGNRQNIFEADFRDLNTEYLESAKNPDTQTLPVRIVATELREAAGRDITGGAIPLPNMTRWMAMKVISRIVRLITADRMPKFDATKKAFRVIAGDIVTVTHEAPGYEEKLFITTTSRDQSPDERAGDRSFVFKEI